MDDPVARRPKARLFVAAPLGTGLDVPLTPDQAHYLRDVLRLRTGDEVLAFNGLDGEWRAAIAALGKSAGGLIATTQMRPQAEEADLWLILAPIKRTRIDFIAEKASELGVSDIFPVMTRRTIVNRVNLERLTANAREAAEQCERLSVPKVHAPRSLEGLLAEYPTGRVLLVCDESGASPSIAEVIRDGQRPESGWAVMIGPEGGFEPDELDLIRKLPFVSLVGLGPRVLRADTAAIAALAVVQALAGDWERRRAPF